MGELSGPHQVPLHENQHGGSRRNRVAHVEFQARRHCAQAQGLVTLEHELFVVGLGRRAQLPYLRLAVGRVVVPKTQGLDIRRDDGVPALETLLDKLLEISQRHTYQVGKGPYDYHVSGSGFSGLLRQFVEGGPDRTAIGCDLEARVV